MTAAKSIVASTGPEHVVEIVVHNVTAAAKFIQIHNAIALPSNGAVPEFTFALASSGSREVQFTVPHHFDTGIVVASSSTVSTLTLSATSDLVGTIIMQGED